MVYPPILLVVDGEEEGLTLTEMKGLIRSHSGQIGGKGV